MENGENDKLARGICVCYKCYVSSFCSDFSANGDDGETETVRGRLQEIIRLMCMVWAKQGLANQLVSGGKKNGADWDRKLPFSPSNINCVLARCLLLSST